MTTKKGKLGSSTPGRGGGVTCERAHESPIYKTVPLNGAGEGEYARMATIYG